MKKVLIALAAFFILIAVITGIGYVYATNWYDQAINEVNIAEGETAQVIVNEGDTFQAVMDKMEADGYIESALAVRIYLQVENVTPNIRFGNYEIPSGVDIPKIIEILEEGQLKPGISVTLREGKTAAEIGDKIQETLGLDAAFNVAKFNDIVANPANYSFSEEVQTFLDTYKPSDKNLEGFIYPDTYEFDVDQDAEVIVNRMIANLISKVNEELDLENLNLTQSNITNFYDALNLGSIVESEASAGDDRTQISGVFHNRLQIGEVLASDATISYITGQTSENLDTRIDSPYNSYTRAGLPPTPISNPRIESIVAAFYPADTDYLFFFHSEDGQTYYSRTLGEHTTKVCQIRGC